MTPKKLKLSSSTETGGQIFELDLNLFGNIDNNLSIWSASSVGRVSFTLKKEKDVHWERLTEDLPPWNCKFWFELQESLGYGTGWMHSSDQGSNVVANGGGGSDKTSMNEPEDLVDIIALEDGTVPISATTDSSSIQTPSSSTTTNTPQISTQKTFEEQEAEVNKQELKQLDALKQQYASKYKLLKMDKSKQLKESRNATLNTIEEINTKARELKSKIEHVNKIPSMLNKVFNVEPFSSLFTYLLQTDHFWKIISIVEAYT